MKEIIHHSPFGGSYTLDITVGRYSNGQTRIQLFDTEDGMPYATATVAIEKHLESDEVAIKDYSENAGILEALVTAGIVYPPHSYLQQNFVKIPICRMK